MIVTQYVKGMIRDTRVYTHIHSSIRIYDRRNCFPSLAGPVSFLSRCHKLEAISNTVHAPLHSFSSCLSISYFVLTVQRVRGLEKHQRSNKITNTEIGEALKPRPVQIKHCHLGGSSTRIGVYRYEIEDEG